MRGISDSVGMCISCNRSSTLQPLLVCILGSARGCSAAPASALCGWKGVTHSLSLCPVKLDRCNPSLSLSFSLCLSVSLSVCRSVLLLFPHSSCYCCDFLSLSPSLSSLLGSAGGCPGSTFTCPVWLERCNISVAWPLSADLPFPFFFLYRDEVVATTPGRLWKPRSTRGNCVSGQMANGKFRRQNHTVVQPVPWLVDWTWTSRNNARRAWKTRSTYTTARQSSWPRSRSKLRLHLFPASLAA